jgi:hypothetical protein
MLFNKNTKRNTMECKFNVDLTGEVKWLEYFDPFTGEYIPVEIKDGVMEETFRAGEGRVYRLRTDDPPAETEETTEEITTQEPETEAPTAAETTEAATTEAATTESPTAEETTAAEKSGCGSALGGSALLLLGGAAWILRKRKHE